MRTIRRVLCSSALLLADFSAVAGEAQDPAAGHALCAAGVSYVDPAILERPVPIREGIGRVSQKVTTSSRDAQAFYDQGLAYLHSYVWIEAARSFREAIRRDEKLAMAWMGLARAEQAMNHNSQVKEAITKAQALAAGASKLEATYVALRAQQIEAQNAPPEKETEKHDAYKRAIEKAIAAHPSEAELWILRGNAEEPGPWGRGQTGGIGAIAYYEAALARYPGHFGAHHYLVHAFENVGRHVEAAEHGKIYAEAVPRVAHAQHMYGHVLPRLGRWKEAQEQFEKADAIEREYARAEKLRPGDDWHHVHNLQLLGFTYLRLGRAHDAEVCFRRAFATPIRYLVYAWQHASLAEYLLLTGRVEEALATARELRNRLPSAQAAGAAVEGEILLALGRAAEAKEASDRAARLFSEAKQAAGSEARWLDRFLAPFIRQIQAEIGLSGEKAAESEATVRAFAEELAANPRFDAWGEGLFRLERIAEQAKRSGRNGLVTEIYATMRRIDPEYAAGSTARPIEAPEVARAGGSEINR
jgi:tetratricopeptide (TPR) repeat protein